MTAVGDVRRPLASWMLMGASGFAGLGYQIVWTQQGALWLGHESASVLAVVAAFFGGLAVGALTLGPRIEKSLRPVRWYAACETVIALWSLLLIVVMPPLGAWLARTTGAQPTFAWQWLVAFWGTFVLLLPATAAMGATLPAMERITSQLNGTGRSIAALYASNTAGAVVGVLAAALWLVPTIGLAASTIVCLVLNLLCGATALLIFPATIAPRDPAGPAPDRAHPVMIRLAVTGLLGIGYEVLVVRVLSQVSEDTVYTFALLLALYLVGTTAGAAAYQRWLSTRPQQALGDVLIAALATACLVGTATLWAAERSRAMALDALGGTVTAAVVAESVPAVLAFGPPTVVMGALFSHLARAALASGASFGRALGINTLGAAVAPALCGVLIAPTFGPKLALLAVSAGYLALIARGSWKRPMFGVPAAVAVALGAFAPPLAFVDVPAGGRILSYHEGVMAAVSVVEDADGVARLRINNRQQEGSSASVRVDGRQAWLPLLLHPAPGRALFLGLGTGVTASLAAGDPTLAVDAVELLPEVIAASTTFTSRLDEGAGAHRLHVLAADARRYVRASDQSYDVIVSDNFHPARSGSGALYTVEHFAAVRRRLHEGGVFCQWLPLHQMDLETLRSIVQAFLAIYPEGWALIASNSLETPVLGLIGRAGETRFDVRAVRTRLDRAALPGRLTGLGFEDEFAVLGTFVAGPASLHRFAASAPANTDDHPVVAYRAPRITYAPDSSPRDRFITLLQQLSLTPAELLVASIDTAWSRRLAAYWTARNRFIESGRAVRPTPRVEDMLAQVREPLLSVLRISPDFRPAYDPLLAMATALARVDVSAARGLFTALKQIQPARDEATRALVGLGPDPSEPSARR